MNDNDINNNPNNSYATPPIHPKLTLRHILNSTLNSGAGSADASLRDRRQQPAAGSAAVPAGSNRRPPLHRVLPDDPTTTNTTAVTGTAATRGSASSRRIESSALPRTHYHRAVATVASQQQQQQQHPSSFPTHPATRFRTRNRALSNLSIVSFPSPAISECQQSRRPSTRAAASSTLGDENKIGSTARSSKNGGLALRNRDVSLSSPYHYPSRVLPNVDFAWCDRQTYLLLHLHPPRVGNPILTLEIQGEEPWQTHLTRCLSMPLAVKVAKELAERII